MTTDNTQSGIGRKKHPNKGFGSNPELARQLAKVQMASLTAEERRARSIKAAQARWARKQVQDAEAADRN